MEKRIDVISMASQKNTTRALAQYGFDVKHICGGFKTFLLHESSKYLV
ncbi:hypothetical protein D3OALGA1CA_3765 [Olavius algarvensis associated proteobacterium Delta 3]|nr:hypothetical protein D3OALGA1CA_3765 [Olavius algarvensis associated proteobacterium Delta 3]CAB5149619.1 hypothetical protein D3OALGB2SA_4724 [Olavius algarvensis associated proteobacterium Delta 3]